MQPQRVVGLILVSGGIILLVLGLRATDSFSSQISKFFTGSPTDRAIWMTFGGIAAIIAGAAATLMPKRA